MRYISEPTKEDVQSGSDTHSLQNAGDYSDFAASMRRQNLRA